MLRAGGDAASLPCCHALLRPEVVWFGEALPAQELDRAFDLSESCDAMLVVGTSGVVQPAASLPFVAARAGALVIDVNPRAHADLGACGFYLEGAGGVVLAQLLEAHDERQQL